MTPSAAGMHPPVGPFAPAGAAAPSRPLSFPAPAPRPPLKPAGGAAAVAASPAMSTPCSPASLFTARDEGDLGGGRTQKFIEQWQRQLPEVKLVVLDSPYRSLVNPVVQFVKQFEGDHRQDRNHFCVIVLPVFVTRRRWENLLHNQSTIVLRNALRAQGTRVVTTVGFYL